jgi:hypothetical protein
MKRRVGFSLALSAITIVAASTGCATSSSTRAKPLATTSGVPVNLGRYQVATVVPFTVVAPNVDPSVGTKLSEDVALRLSSDFGPLFREVRRASAPLGAEDEVLVSGTIHKYRAGNKVARAIFGPPASATFEGDVTVTDARYGHVLLTAPFDKFWGWAGIAGATKGIDDMSTETAAAIANTIAQAKGWRPPVRQSASR